jgi:hypothetical protein
MMMANDWAGLDDGTEASQSSDDNVEYIGMVESNEPEQPVRTPRRPVQRVAPVSNSYPAQRPVVNPGGSGRRRGGGEEPLIYYPTATGAQLALNAEAVNNIRRSKPQSINGQPAYRIQPGQYVMVVPGKGPSPRVDESAVGTFDDLLNDLATTGGGTAGQRAGVGTDAAGWMSSIGQILDPLARLGIGIATTVTGSQQAERQASLDRRRLELEAEAAAAGRATAAETATRAHQETMARIRQQQAELATLQQAQNQTAAASSALGPVSGGGTSPVVWVLLAVVGLGGIGGLVWFLSSRKSKQD